MVNRMHRKTIC